MTMPPQPLVVLPPPAYRLESLCWLASGGRVGACPLCMGHDTATAQAHRRAVLASANALPNRHRRRGGHGLR